MPNWKKLARQALIVSGCLSAIPITCNSILAKKKDDGYAYVYVTGSNIPKRVKVGDAVGTESPVSTMSTSEFTKLQQQQTMPLR
jgi:hypothetical protein